MSAPYTLRNVVGRAMYEAHCIYHGFNPRWDDEPALSKASWRNQAQAAITILAPTAQGTPTRRAETTGSVGEGGGGPVGNADAPKDHPGTQEGESR